MTKENFIKNFIKKLLFYSKLLLLLKKFYKENEILFNYNSLYKKNFSLYRLDINIFIKCYKKVYGLIKLTFNEKQTQTACYITDIDSIFKNMVLGYVLIR